MIVSDVVDYTEPFFEAGPVASLIKAYTDAIDAGLLFVQAAGDHGQSHYQANLDLVNVTLGGQEKQLHRFGGPSP